MTLTEPTPGGSTGLTGSHSGPAPISRPIVVYGMDIGKVKDPAVMCCLSSRPGIARSDGDPLPVWNVHRIEALPLGTPYAVQAAYAASAASVAPVAMDATGIGAAVLEATRNMATADVVDRIIGITWTGGNQGRHESADWKVAKNVLIHNLVRAIDHDGIRIHPRTSGAATLTKQMRTFVRDLKGNGAANALSGHHDDYIAALMIAAYIGDAIANHQAVTIKL